MGIFYVNPLGKCSVDPGKATPHTPQARALSKARRRALVKASDTPQGPGAPERKPGACQDAPGAPLRAFQGLNTRQLDRRTDWDKLGMSGARQGSTQKGINSGGPFPCPVSLDLWDTLVKCADSPRNKKTGAPKSDAMRQARGALAKSGYDASVILVRLERAPDGAYPRVALFRVTAFLRAML